MVEKANEVFRDSKANAAIAAGATETITSTIGNRRQYGPFNRLIVSNRDAVDIQIQLDGEDSVGAGRIFDIASGESLILDKEFGETFQYFVVKNLDATTAEVVDAIQFRWSKIVDGV